MQLAVLAADQGLGQPVGVVDEVEGEAALDAEVAVVRDVRRVGGDLDDPLRLRVDVQVDLAADAAERAGRLRLGSPRLVRRPARPPRTSRRSRRSGRPRGSRRRARTRCRASRLPHVGTMRASAAAALERERRALHHLLRVADAARAEDAGLGVVAHQQVAVLVRLALRVRQHDRRLDAEILGERDELVRPPARDSRSGARRGASRSASAGTAAPTSSSRRPSPRRPASRRRASAAASPRRRRRTSGSRRRGRACRRGRGSGRRRRGGRARGRAARPRAR